jgi:hypothetical protein
MTRPPIVVRTARIFVAVFAVVLATAGCTITTHGATEPTTFPATSDGPVYLVDADTNIGYAKGSQLDWDAALGVILSAIPEPTAPTDSAPMRLPFVTGSLTETPFISAPGAERTPARWKAWSDTINLNGKGPLLPNVTPSGLIYGTPAGVKAAGGTYSLGVAYEDSPTHVTAAFFTTINVDAGTGTWKFATPPRSP